MTSGLPNLVSLREMLFDTLALKEGMWTWYLESIREMSSEGQDEAAAAIQGQEHGDGAQGLSADMYSFTYTGNFAYKDTQENW